jgi:uncharacterized protein
MIEHKSFDVELKADDAGMVELYAAAFGNVDRQREVIAPGAFVNLDEFVKSGWIAVNHEWDDLPVASVASAVQDMSGLRVTAEWHTTDEAQACRTVVKERMARGKAVKCSIGYRVLEDEMEQRDGMTIRVLKRVELYEASIVNLPANPQAEVVGVKSWWHDLEDAYVALKEGRTLSGRNRDRLKACHSRMKEACDELGTLLTETEPVSADSSIDMTADVPKSHGGNRLVADLLANEARFPTYLLR